MRPVALPMLGHWMKRDYTRPRAVTLVDGQMVTLLMRC